MREKFKILIIFLILGLLSFADCVYAQNAVDPEQQPIIRLLREFSVFINVILLILIVLLVICLGGALKYLGGKDSWKNKIKLIWHFLSKEPAQIFSQLAKRDRTGTYLLPFESYKRLHSLSQKTLLRTLSLIILQLSIIAFLIYSLTALSHYSRAFDTKSLESNNFILQLDK